MPSRCQGDKRKATDRAKTRGTTVPETFNVRSLPLVLCLSTPALPGPRSPRYGDGLGAQSRTHAGSRASVGNRRIHKTDRRMVVACISWLYRSSKGMSAFTGRE